MITILSILDHGSGQSRRKNQTRGGAPTVKKYHIIIVSGLSGSGKSTTVGVFEDAGFYCVDNMPVLLLPKFLELPIQDDKGIKGLAFVMDAREKSFPESWPRIFEELRSKGYQFEILFLEADETVLQKRFSETRRHHPLSGDGGLTHGIQEEKNLLAPLRAAATRVIDTSFYTIHELRSVISGIARSVMPGASMRLGIASFGFKHGIPHDADIIMDVRFLPNPFFVPELKDLDGRNEIVKQYVLNQPITRDFLQKWTYLMDFLLPLYEKEGKSYLTISIGCTGGRHRSVVIASALAEHIQAFGRTVALRHRDIDRV